MLLLSPPVAHGRSGFSRDKRREDNSSAAGRDAAFEASPKSAGLGTISHPAPCLGCCCTL